MLKIYLKQGLVEAILPGGGLTTACSKALLYRPRVLIPGGVQYCLRTRGIGFGLPVGPIFIIAKCHAPDVGLET